LQHEEQSAHVADQLRRRPVSARLLADVAQQFEGPLARAARIAMNNAPPAGAGMTVVELAELAEVPAITAHRALKRLARLGYLTREPGAGPHPARYRAAHGVHATDRPVHEID
jgi:Fic family protein